MTPSASRARATLRLARIEAALLARSILVLAGLLVSGILAWVVTDRGQPLWWNAGWVIGYGQTVISLTTLIAAQLATARVRRDRLQELYESFPSSAGRRTLAHLISLIGVVPACLVLIGAATGVFELRNSVGTPDLAVLSGGVLLVLAGARSVSRSRSPLPPGAGASACWAPRSRHSRRSWWPAPCSCSRSSPEISTSWSARPPTRARHSTAPPAPPPPPVSATASTRASARGCRPYKARSTASLPTYPTNAPRPLTISQTSGLTLDDPTLTHGHLAQQVATGKARAERSPANLPSSSAIYVHLGTWPDQGHQANVRFDLALGTAEWALGLPANTGAPSSLRSDQCMGPQTTAAGYLLATAMTKLPTQRVTAVLHANWDTWTSGHQLRPTRRCTRHSDARRPTGLLGPHGQAITPAAGNDPRTTAVPDVNTASQQVRRTQ
jgi:hypothetical protein